MCLQLFFFPSLTLTNTGIDSEHTTALKFSQVNIIHFNVCTASERSKRQWETGQAKSWLYKICMGFKVHSTPCLERPLILPQSKSYDWLSGSYAWETRLAFPELPWLDRKHISADSNRKGWAGSSLIITQPWLQHDLNRTAKNPATGPKLTSSFGWAQASWESCGICMGVSEGNSPFRLEGTYSSYPRQRMGKKIFLNESLLSPFHAHFCGRKRLDSWYLGQQAISSLLQLRQRILSITAISSWG